MKASLLFRVAADLAHDDRRPLLHPRVSPVPLLIAVLTTFAVLHVQAPTSHALPSRPWFNQTNVADTTATDWMAQLPDYLLISELSIPGTHDTHSFYGGSYRPGCAICQTVPLYNQLQAGIRAFDIRLRHYEDLLRTYHGAFQQNSNFTEGCWAIIQWGGVPCGCGGVLDACSEFLQDHPGETIFLAVAANCGSVPFMPRFYCNGSALSFSEAVEGALAAYSDYVYPWPVDDCDFMPTLGAVRGKIVILQSFIGDYHLDESLSSEHTQQKGRVSCVRDPDALMGPDLSILSTHYDASGYGSDTAVAFHNRGDATFTRAAVTQNQVSDKWTSVCSGDFDSNGYDDVAIVNNPEDAVDVCFMDSSGPVSWIGCTVGHEPLSAVAADFDFDGDQDIVVTAWDTYSLNMLRNDGHGNFVREDEPTGHYAYGLTVANLNGDQFPDLVTVHQSPVFLENDYVRAELGPFGEQSVYANINCGCDTYPEQVVAADFDADSLVDVAVCFRDGYIKLFRNTGSTLSVAGTITTGGDLRALATANVGGDQAPDLIVANIGTQEIQVCLNAGSFQFDLYAIPVGSRNPIGLIAADFDSDHQVDLAVTEWGPSNESWGLDRAYILRNKYGGELWCPGKALGPYWNYLPMQNFYGIRGWGVGGVAEKVDLIKDHIDRAQNCAHPESLFVNFLSGVDWRSAEVTCQIAPNEVANATGCSTYVYLKDALTAGEVWRCGIIMADFPGDGLIDAVIGHNRYGCFQRIHDGLPGVQRGGGTWGDYDNDGDLDVTLTGESVTGPIAAVFRNNGGSFIDIGAGLTGVLNGSATWGDYDNDGALDLIVSGSTGPGYTASIYRNDTGSFTDIDAGLTGVNWSASAWGDYDNDGDLDLLLAGYEGYATYVSKVYRNDSGSFTDIGAGLTGTARGAVAWGDYDNDGDLDIVLTGTSITGPPYEWPPVSKIYRNDAGSFVDIGATLAQVSHSALAWGDYDTDGDLDLVLSGNTGEEYSAGVYRNDGGSFSDVGAVLPGVEDGSVAWGDHDNDGDLDILLTGASWASHTDTLYVSRVYRNEGGSFNREFFWMVPVTQGSAAWGDYDADGDLDILLAGGTGGGACQSVVYRNEQMTANTPPSGPTNLSAQVSDSTMTFNWDAATDAETPSPGLTYNLRVGTTPGGGEICSAMADAGTGYRWLPAVGNTNHNTGWTIEFPTPVPPMLYWSVQALDACFAGSQFATEQGSGVPAIDTPATRYALHPVSPNPFGSGTTIRYDLPRSGKAKLALFNVAGRWVCTLLNGEQGAGRYSLVWDGRDAAGTTVAPGVYFVRLESETFSAAQKIVLTR